MLTLIYEMDEKTGNIEKKSEYTIEGKKALIAYIMQLQKNFNTWDYPNDIKGIRESKVKKNHFYFDDNKRNIIIAAYQQY